MNTLEEPVTSKAMPLEETLRYATSLAEVLRQLHRDGAVCGCLDPAHIVWDNHSVKLAPNASGGTGAYLAPEQVRGETADARSDIFVFGAIVYELLSRRRAFPAEDPEELKRQILECSPPPLEGIDSSLLGVGCDESQEVLMGVGKHGEQGADGIPAPLTPALAWRSSRIPAEPYPPASNSIVSGMTLAVKR